MKRNMFLASVLAATTAVSGCYGPFNLTRKLHSWNGQVGGPWVNEFVFLGLAALSVYPVSVLADAIVFNSWQFWTGKNPVTAKNVRSIEQGDAQAVLSYTPESHRLRVDSFQKGKLASTYIFEPGVDGMVARNVQGEVLMTAKTVAGMIVLQDGSGKPIGQYDPARIPEIVR
jgi:hypothetical protein